MSFIKNIDFPELDGPAMIAVNGCINHGSIVSKFMVENLVRVADIFSSYSSLVYNPSSGSGFGCRLGNPSPFILDFLTGILLSILCTFFKCRFQII